MTLLPQEDLLQKEIESWNNFVFSLRQEDRKLFKRMLNECYQYQEAINARGQPFPSEALLMSLVFTQRKMIDLLIKKLNSI